MPPTNHRHSRRRERLKRRRRRRRWVGEWRRTRTSSSRIGDPRERISSITSAGRVATSLSSESSASPSQSSSTRASSKISICKTKMLADHTESSS
ncbi:hypothetical protein HID58_015873, partial [Brassica napus]